MKRGPGRQSLPNLVSASRLVMAGLLLPVPAFSPGFWLLYALGGLSDLLDGWLARRLQAQSHRGQLLDSWADLAFLAVLLGKTLLTLPLPPWALWWGGGVAVLRLASLGLGYGRFHSFAWLHTWGNKGAGMALFAFPLLRAGLGPVPALVLCLLATSLSAGEELLLLCTCSHLDRDCPGLWKRA